MAVVSWNRRWLMAVRVSNQVFCSVFTLYYFILVTFFPHHLLIWLFSKNHFKCKLLNIYTHRETYENSSLKCFLLRYAHTGAVGTTQAFPKRVKKKNKRWFIFHYLQPLLTCWYCHLSRLCVSVSVRMCVSMKVYRCTRLCMFLYLCLAPTLACRPKSHIWSKNDYPRSTLVASQLILAEDLKAGFLVWEGTSITIKVPSPSWPSSTIRTH